MITPYNAYEGEPERIYRNPCDIRRDIAEISRKIEETNNMLNVRGLLLDVISACGEEELDKWIPEIEEIVEEAKETLLSLSELEDSLSQLTEELRETRWVMGL